MAKQRVLNLFDFIWGETFLTFSQKVLSLWEKLVLLLPRSSFLHLEVTQIPQFLFNILTPELLN